MGDGSYDAVGTIGGPHDYKNLKIGYNFEVSKEHTACGRTVRTW